MPRSLDIGKVTAADEVEVLLHDLRLLLDILATVEKRLLEAEEQTKAESARALVLTFRLAATEAALADARSGGNQDLTDLATADRGDPEVE